MEGPRCADGGPRLNRAGAHAGTAAALFESADLRSGAAAPQYNVSADGQRFVTMAPVEDGDEESAPPKIHVVQNWYEEIRDREQD